MSPVIRVSDSIYKRLEAQAIGFDNPSSVIERLIDFYESQHKTSAKSNFDFGEKDKSIRTVKQASVSIKRLRDPEKERQLKEAVGKALGWGDFRLVSNTVLEFQNPRLRVLCKYSSYSPELDRWFWGVGRKYWSKWNENSYLALLMQNEDYQTYSFILLKSKDASILFTKCSESAGEKKINLRFYKSDCIPHFQEWQEYDVKKNIRKIEN